ncbi:ribonuclease P protein subunit p29 [Chlamydoabsidia padenii]|nr:ribonuclease P protein subunit p29 [Chlamydoabsidia padenii]
MRPVHLHGGRMIIEKKIQKRQPRNRPLNARERRALNIYDLDPAAIIYTNFIPLHDLWNGYMNDLKDGGEGLEQFAQKLLKADFHGSILTVTKCKNPVYIGCTGIVIQETMNVFALVTKANKVKKIPKAGTIFLLTACNQSFTLYGNQLQFRAAERAAKKFKLKPTIDL